MSGRVGLMVGRRFPTLCYVTPEAKLMGSSPIRGIGDLFIFGELPRLIKNSYYINVNIGPFDFF